MIKSVLYTFAFIVGFVFHKCASVIIEPNERNYDLMPPVFEMDPYSKCINELNSIYCIVDIHIQENDNSSLYHIIKYYSEKTGPIFNHLELHRGVCLEKCWNLNNLSDVFNFKNIDSTFEMKTDVMNQSLLWTTVEKCVNESIYEEYKLEGKINKIRSCRTSEEPETYGVGKSIYFVVCLIIVVANFVGSAYDIYTKRQNIKAVQWLLCFSFPKNYHRLISKDKNATRSKKIVGFEGMRFCSNLVVISIHMDMLFTVIAIENIKYFETLHLSLPFSMVASNAALAMNTFFVMSSFLLAHNYMTLEDDSKSGLLYYVKNIIERYLRITPLYALFLCAAIFKIPSGDGVLNAIFVDQEAEKCRRNWWMHMLYVNNLFTETICGLHTWYLAADMQLHLYGLAIIMLIWRYPKIAKYLFPVLFLANVLIPGIVTYVNRLYPIMKPDPEYMQEAFENSNSFRYNYIPTYANSGSYTIGLFTGYCYYILQQKKIEIINLKAFRYIYNASVPLMLLTFISGAIFYLKGQSYRPLLSAIYSGLFRNIYAVTISVLIIGIANNYKSVIVRFLEWRPFQVLGQLSYCAYLLHYVILQAYAAKKQHTTHFSLFNYELTFIGILSLTYILALPISLMVEVPARNLQKLVFGEKKRQFGIAKDNSDCVEDTKL